MGKNILSPAEQKKAELALRVEQPDELDFNALDEICAKGLMEQKPPPTYEEACRIAAYFHGFQYRLMYDEEDQVKGVLVFSIPEHGDYIKIEFLHAVEKRKGIGTLLINDIENLARGYKIPRLVLEVSADDPDAKAFYRNYGFTEYITRRERFSEVKLINLEKNVHIEE